MKVGRPQTTGKFKTRTTLIIKVVFTYYNTKKSMRAVGMLYGVDAATVYRILCMDCRSSVVRKRWRNDL